jgi:hypothetical protein
MGGFMSYLSDRMVKDGRCRICGKPVVTEDVVREFNDIDWCEREDDEEHYRDDLCWGVPEDECRDADGRPIEDVIEYLVERAERAEASVAELEAESVDAFVEWAKYFYAIDQMPEWVARWREKRRNENEK